MAGYLQATWLYNGQSDTAPAKQESYQYFQHAGYVAVDDVSSGAVTTGSSAFASTIYPLASVTDYRNSDGSGAISTSYAYAWHDLPGTSTVSDQPHIVTTNLPTPPTGQNGPTSGTQWQTLAVFDPFGNEIWYVDADGYITLNQYNTVTGLLMETVANVNTSATLPSAITDAADTVAVPLIGGVPLFATPSGDWNFNATTDFLYDVLGSVELGPQFENSAGHEVRTATFTLTLHASAFLAPGETSTDEPGSREATLTATGYEDLTSSAYVLVNPISVAVSNLDGQTTDDLAIESGSGASVIESSTDNVLIAMAIAMNSPGGHSAWTHFDYAKSADTTNGYFAAGDLIDQKVYTNIASAAYDETFYRYNSVGLESETLDPSGTITEAFHDVRGLVTSVYVGTSDGTTWPAGSSTSVSNMVEVQSNEYDNGADGGDGNLTTTTEYVGGSQPNRVTEYGDDWRDRQLSSMSYDGTRYTYAFNTFDNLDEVTETRQFQAAAAWTVAPATDTLLSDTTAAFDDLGRLYQSTAWQIVSAARTTAQTTNYRHDADGNVVELDDPDDNATTWQFDGLGEIVSQTNQLSESDLFAYNSAGLLTQKTDAIGRAIAYAFDGIGREVAENWYTSVDTSGNPAGSPMETINYVYLPSGRLYSATDENVTAGTSAIDTYSYDDAGRVTSETQQLPGLTPVVTLADQYTGGNRTQLAATIGTTNDFVDNYQYLATSHKPLRPNEPGDTERKRRQRGRGEDRRVPI